eukprot:12495462-Ditylum_brightwellii.AAC.1
MKHVFDASSLLNSTTTTTTKEEEEKSSIIPQVDFLCLLSTSTLLHAIAEGPKLKEQVIATSLVEFEKEWSEYGGIVGYEDESGSIKGGWEYRPIEKVLAKMIKPMVLLQPQTTATAIESI